jgi:hypothetical protein
MRAGFGSHRSGSLHPDPPMSTLCKPNFQTRWPVAQSKPPISLFFFFGFLGLGRATVFLSTPRFKFHLTHFLYFCLLSVQYVTDCIFCIFFLLNFIKYNFFKGYEIKFKLKIYYFYKFFNFKWFYFSTCPEPCNVLGRPCIMVFVYIPTFWKFICV